MKVTKNIITDVKEILTTGIEAQDSGDCDKYNILLNDFEYSYLQGLLHVDIPQNKVVFFTDKNYQEDTYYTTIEIKNIINNIYNISKSNPSTVIINIKELIQKVVDRKYSNLSYDIYHKISTIFKKTEIELLFKLHRYKSINISSSIKISDLNNIKDQLSSLIYDLLDSITTYKNNYIDSLLDGTYYDLPSKTALNLTSTDIKFLEYISNNTPRLDEFNEKGKIFKQIYCSFLDEISNLEINKSKIVSKLKETTILKTNKNFQIHLIYDKENYNQHHKLLFKFNNLKVFSTKPYAWDPNLDHFIVGYLTYLDEYYNITAYFKNKLFQAM